MQARIKSIFPVKSHYRFIDIFGYSSRGIPGLEIIGLGKMGRATKEKFLYLTRVFGLQLPMRRFVLCVEDDDILKEASSESIRWLELPLLILFWSLAEQLSIQKLEDCLTSGTISVSGKVEFYPKSIEQLERITELFVHYDENIKWIAPHELSLPGEVLHLPLEPLFEKLNQLTLN